MFRNNAVLALLFGTGGGKLISWDVSPDEHMPTYDRAGSR